MVEAVRHINEAWRKAIGSEDRQRNLGISPEETARALKLLEVQRGAINKKYVYGEEWSGEPPKGLAGWMNRR
jgi:hypothetical protein